MSRYENEDISTIVIIVALLAFGLGLFVENKYHLLTIITLPVSEVQK